MYTYFLEPETDIADILDMIKYDSDISFPNLQQHWSATVQFRLNEIKKANSTTDILNEWKSYSQPLGYKLVNITWKEVY